MRKVGCLHSPCLPTGMFPGCARQLMEKERPWMPPMSCFHANGAGNSNENNENKKEVEIENGCFASRVMIFKAKELNRK